MGIEQETPITNKGQFSERDCQEAADNPEWTEEDFARAKPFGEVFPSIAEKLRRGRSKQKAPTKELVSLRLNRDALARFRALGPGWQQRINEAVTQAAKELP